MNVYLDPNQVHTQDWLANTTASQKEQFIWGCCGLIPKFFLEACDKVQDSKDISLDNLASHMDALYQFGGFNVHPMGGTLTDQGVYQYPEDDDLDPLVILEQDEFQCLIFEYGITAIRKKDQLDVYKVARFD